MMQSVARLYQLLVTFGVAFHFFVADNRRDFKFGMWVKPSNSQHAGNKPSLK